jgi:hypothetical protein
MSEVLTAEEREALRARHEAMGHGCEMGEPDCAACAINRLAASHAALEREVAAWCRATTPEHWSITCNPERARRYRETCEAHRHALRTLVADLAGALRAACDCCRAVCGDDAPRGYVQRCEDHAALLARADAETGGRDGG